MNSLTLVFFHLLLASAFRLNSAGCPGCSSPVSDPNNDDIRKLMSSSLSKTNAGYTLTKVKSCTSQVVSGIKYNCEVEIKSPSGEVANCHLVVVDHPWEANPQEILSESCSSVSRSKREICAGCPGKLSEPNSAEMQKKLNGVLGQTNSDLSLVKNVECTSQVVAGIKYDCEIQVESPKINGVQTCRIAFVEQSWISPDPNVIVDTCSKLVRNKRALCAGCPSEINNPNSPDMQKKLNGVLGQTNSDLSLVKNVQCTSQVVAGIKYDCEIQVESPKINGVQTCRISFVEQPWISPDPNVVVDTCSKLVRNKREICAGCPVEQDPGSSEVKNKLTGILSQTNSGLNLLRAKKCTSQVVAGAKWTCELEVESPKTNGPKTCTISFLEQPWISSEPQILSDTCSQLVRNKREVCTGCPIEQNPEDPEIHKTLTDTLSQTNSGLGLVGVDKCTTQVVSGVMYDCTIRVNSPHFNGVESCRLKILEQPWVDPQPQVVYDSCSQLNNRAKRSVENMRLGGYTPVHTNGPEVQNAAQFAAQRINNMVNSMYVKKIVSIEQAATQLVSGMNYAMTIVLGDTDCTKNSGHKNTDCHLLPNPRSNLVCNVIVYEKPWEKITELSSVHCQDVPNVMRARRSVDGGINDADVNSPEIQGLNNYLSGEVTQRTNSPNLVKVVKTLSATQQVVAGWSYTVKVLVATTDCPANVNANPASCAVSNSPNEQVCEVTVWDRPWLNKKEVTSFQCTKA